MVFCAVVFSVLLLLWMWLLMLLCSYLSVLLRAATSVLLELDSTCCTPATCYYMLLRAATCWGSALSCPHPQHEVLLPTTAPNTIVEVRGSRAYWYLLNCYHVLLFHTFDMQQ